MEEKKKILFIEDEVELSVMITKLLSLEGYDVRTAHNGEEGLEKLKEFTPHLIILDICMPKMGGIEFYKRICDPKSRPKFPVIVLTTYGHMEGMFRELDIDGFITKPCQISDLLREIELVINKGRLPGRGEEQPAEGKKFKQVLIVDDNSEAVERMSRRFAEVEISSTNVRNGGGVLGCIFNRIPDLLLINLHLPDMPGDTVVSKLRHMPRTRNIPVILYTAACPELDHIVTRIVCERVGINHFVATNDPGEILREIMNIEKEQMRLRQQDDQTLSH